MPSPGYQQPAPDRGEIQRRQEQERQQRELNEAEQKAREQEEARRRKFEENKQNALKLLKSGAGELGLKGEAGAAMELRGTKPNGLTLKEPLFSKGSQGSAPPDLSDLNPKWPIVVDPSKVQGQTAQALKEANLRTHALLDALEAGAGDWLRSIASLEGKVKKNPAGRHFRDALNLLRGYHAGYLGAKNISDNYYKFGVRQWLDGDFDQAARAFARAFRENPDDMQLYGSFAHTLGLRDGSGRCQSNTRCSHLDIPAQPIPEELGIVQDVQRKLEKLRAEVNANPGNLPLRATLNHLEGWAGYHDYLSGVPDEKQKPLDKKSWRLTSQGLDKIGAGNYAGAVKDFSEAYADNAGDRGILFVTNYAKGLFAAQADETGHIPAALWDRRTSEAYADYVDDMLGKINAELFPPKRPSATEMRRQLTDTEAENPFFGFLSDEDVERLRQGDESLFR